LHQEGGMIYIITLNWNDWVDTLAFLEQGIGIAL
jgi:hypothetical protein